MASHAFDHVEPAPAFAQLPIAMTFRTTRTSSIVKLLMLAPALAAMMVPLTFLAVHAMAEPASLSLLSEHPVASVQVLLGLGLWAALFLWPIKRVIGRMGASRSVRIDDGRIEVTDTSLRATRCWSEPIAAYAGIAHLVRAGLSGLRHELVLVHRDATKNVLIAIADRIPQSTVDQVKVLLGLPEVPAKALYDSSLLTPRAHPAPAATVIAFRAAA